MPCERVGNAIVCSRGPRRRKAQLCACGSVSTRMCDWKIGKPARGEKQKTCDRPLCVSCTTSPTEDKDLCADHAAAWQRQQELRGVAP